MKSRSQWPRDLRHEMSSLAWTLGSWIRIPLKAWVSVLFRVQVETLRRADPPSKDSYRLCKKDYETEEEARDQQKGCRTVDEWMKRERG
jgi:hypothetical protein